MMNVMDLLFYILAPLLFLAIILWFFQRSRQANEADWGKPWLNLIDGMNRIFCRVYHRLQADHIPLPAEGPALLVSNHISGLDPLLLVSACRRPLRFLIAREEYERFGLKWFFRAMGCIPVDRSGRPETAFREALRALSGGEVIALFPHGGIHVTRQTDEQPARIKGGVIRLAQRSGTNIYPVLLEGVRFKGQVVLPLFLRGRARLRVLPQFDCDSQDYGQCLSDLAYILHDLGE